MNKKWKVSILTLSLVGLMATSAFATNDVTAVRNRFFGRFDGQKGYEVLAEKTGKSVEELKELRATGVTCFDLAKENDIDLEELRQQMLEKKLTFIDEKVNSGDLTEEEAQVIKERIQERTNLCSGQGLGRGMGRMMSKFRGMGFGARLGRNF